MLLQPLELHLQVIPLRIERLDQRDLLLSPPALDLLLPLDCITRAAEVLEVHKPLDAIPLRESGHQPLAMLRDAPGKVVRHADVQRARMIGHDVNEVALHATEIKRPVHTYQGLSHHERSHASG